MKKNINRKILIITTSGGSGHLQTAKAIKEELLKKNPKTEILQKELLTDFVSRGFKKGIGLFNFAQRKGSVFSKEILVKTLFLLDFCVFPKVFFSFLFFLLKNNFDEIIDNQPVCPAGLLKAIRVYNMIRKKNLILEKVIVDLPTKRTTNFFGGIKRLSKKDKKNLKVVSLKPLLEDEKTDEEFWQKHLKIPASQIVYMPYLVRKVFKDLKVLKKTKDKYVIEIFIKNKVFKNYILKTLQKTKTYFSDQNIFLENNTYKISFFLAKKDRLITILLGSQPDIKATKDYLICLKDFFKKNKSLKTFYLFIYLFNEESIFKETLDVISKDKKFPENLKVILMPFQDEKTIAKLFFRSDITITRSGGSTCLELLALNKKNAFIHTSSNKNEIEGIPFWEAGNFLYLKNKIYSKLVNSKNLSKFIKDLI